MLLQPQFPIFLGFQLKFANRFRRRESIGIDKVSRNCRVHDPSQRHAISFALVHRLRILKDITKQGTKIPNTK
jgi:hypothetical protein